MYICIYEHRVTQTLLIILRIEQFLKKKGKEIFDYIYFDTWKLLEIPEYNAQLIF